MPIELLSSLLSKFLVAVSVCVPRISLAFAFSGFFSKSLLTGASRSVVIFSIASFLYPVTMNQMPTANISSIIWASIFLKEAFLGCLIGILASMGIWVYEIIGSVVDNQRGASFASAMNPISNTESSVLGIFMLNLIVTIFFVGGFFLNFLRILYFSFLSWPIFEFFPQLSHQFGRDCLSILSYIFNTGITFASPILLMMFISEAGLAFVNRFAPQLQVFFLAMPIKSIVAFFVLSLYFWILVESSSTILMEYTNYLSRFHYHFANG